MPPRNHVPSANRYELWPHSSFPSFPRKRESIFSTQLALYPAADKPPRYQVPTDICTRLQPHFPSVFPVGNVE